MLYEPASRVLHRVSASYGRPRRRLLEQQSCNEELVFWRNLPGRDLGGAAVACGGVGGQSLPPLARGTLAPFVCGRLRLLGEVRRLLRHRREAATLGPAAPLESWGVERRYWS